MKQTKYLIFAEVGGDQGNPYRGYMHYYICEGKELLDALKDWYVKVQHWVLEKNPNYKLREPKFGKMDDIWYESGYVIQVVELKEDEGFNDWKKLKWV